MPFSSGGIYTAPAAATDTFAGKVIASADWNSIFTDIQTALTQLGEQAWTNTPKVISSAGNYTVTATDSVLFIENNVGTIVLPLSSARSYPVKIMGAAASIFASYNAVVLPTSPDTISGSSSATLTTNYQVAILYPLSSGGYILGS